MCKPVCYFVFIVATVVVPVFFFQSITYIANIIINYVRIYYACVWYHNNCYIIITVPRPIVSVTAPSNQTAGQPLTLQCEVTTVRGITSRADIVWSSGGIVLRKTNDTISTTMDISLVYTDSYTISQLSTTDDGRVIQCEVVINASPPVMASDSTTLDVIGKYVYVTGECKIQYYNIRM